MGWNDTCIIWCTTLERANIAFARARKPSLYKFEQTLSQYTVHCTKHQCPIRTCIHPTWYKINILQNTLHQLWIQYLCLCKISIDNGRSVVLYNSDKQKHTCQTLFPPKCGLPLQTLSACSPNKRQPWPSNSNDLVHFIGCSKLSCIIQ